MLLVGSLSRLFITIRIIRRIVRFEVASLAVSGDVWSLSR